MEEQIQFYLNKLNYEMDPADLFEALEKGGDYVVIDTRKPFGFEREHIPGAINLPHGDMDAKSTRNLDRHKTYVCYCDGIGCNGSTKGALNMVRLGFRVRELKGGLEWWKLDGFQTAGSKSTDGTQLSCAC